MSDVAINAGQLINLNCSANTRIERWKISRGGMDFINTPTIANKFANGIRNRDGFDFSPPNMTNAFVFFLFSSANYQYREVFTYNLSVITSNTTSKIRYIDFSGNWVVIDATS
jgi:hypothetical protein